MKATLPTPPKRHFFFLPPKLRKRAERLGSVGWEFEIIIGRNTYTQCTAGVRLKDGNALTLRSECDFTSIVPPMLEVIRRAEKASKTHGITSR